MLQVRRRRPSPHETVTCSLGPQAAAVAATLLGAVPNSQRGWAHDKGHGAVLQQQHGEQRYVTCQQLVMHKQVLQANQ
jgi:hypothetical protein